jgi:predicted dehydrogenase
MLNRRHFLLASTTAAMSAVQSPDRKLRLGVIGAGWYGMVDMNAALENGNVECSALADVDTAHLDEAATEMEKKQGVRPRTFRDYRELLQMPGLDAVIIATMPHWHALPFIAAAEKGLAVYLEKPVAWDMMECLAMLSAQKKYGTIVQVGFQRRQENGYSAARQYIQSGAPGRVLHVDAAIHYRPGLLDATPQTPPATLDWDAWCGPAPKLPYSPQVGHKAWRLEKEYGHGHLIDWGIHVIDATRRILGASAPKRVSASGGLFELKGKITTPDSLTAQFEFEQAPVTWRHRMFGGVEVAPEFANGAFFYCEKETVFATDQRWSVFPRAKGEARRDIEVSAFRDQQKRHLGDFLQAVREKRQPSCTLEDGIHSTHTVQLGMIAYESASVVEWDAATRRLTGSPAAQKLMKRPYRAPWRYPA